MNCPLEEAVCSHPVTLATSLSTSSGDGRWILLSLIKDSISEAGFIGRENREESGRYQSGKQKHPSPGGPLGTASPAPGKWCCYLNKQVRGVTRSCYSCYRSILRVGLYPGRVCTCSEELGCMGRRTLSASCGAGGWSVTLWQS